MPVEQYTAEKAKKYRSRIRASKALLGDFVVQFENVMDQIRDTIFYILRTNGLNTREYGMILLHDSTASNLKNYYLAYVKLFHKDIYAKQKAAETYLKILIDKIEEATSLRNVILHSTWDFFPNASDHRQDKFSGQRFKVGRTKGLYNYFYKLPSKNEFQQFNKSLKILNKVVEKALHNLMEGKSINANNEKIDLITFKWQGTDFPYQNFGTQ